MENEDLGEREVHFSKELYIERDDFMVDPPKKYKRLTMENEVRLMGAYFVKAVSYECDEEEMLRLCIALMIPRQSPVPDLAREKPRERFIGRCKTAFTADGSSL